jgi:hypothetical protein
MDAMLIWIYVCAYDRLKTPAYLICVIQQESFMMIRRFSMWEGKIAIYQEDESRWELTLLSSNKKKKVFALQSAITNYL